MAVSLREGRQFSNFQPCWTRVFFEWKPGRTCPASFQTTGGVAGRGCECGKPQNIFWGSTKTEDDFAAGFHSIFFFLGGWSFWHFFFKRSWKSYHKRHKLVINGLNFWPFLGDWDFWPLGGRGFKLDVVVLSLSGVWHVMGFFNSRKTWKKPVCKNEDVKYAWWWFSFFCNVIWEMTGDDFISFGRYNTLSLGLFVLFVVSGLC